MDNVNEFSQPIVYLNPGNIDALRGPYATAAAACAAIPDQVDENGKNFREGKFVEIGTDPDYVTYWWKGGYQDNNLIPVNPYLDRILIDAAGNFYIIDQNQNIGLQLTPEGLLRIGAIEINGSQLNLLDLAKIADLNNLSESINPLRTSIVIDDSGSVFFIDDAGNIGLKLTPDGKLLIGALNINGSDFDQSAFAKPSDLIPIGNNIASLQSIVQNDNRPFYAVTDALGNIIAKSVSNGSFQFLGVLTDLLNVGNAQIKESPDNSLELVDPNGWIGWGIDKSGNVLGTTVVPDYPPGILETMVPKRIYSLYNDVLGEKKSCYVYLDHLILLPDATKNKVRFDNQTDKVHILPVKAAAGSVHSEVVPLNTGKGDWDALAMSTVHKSVKASVLQPNKVILMPVGDSQTWGQAASFADATGMNDVYWMQLLSDFKKLTVSNPTFKGAITVGNMYKRTRSFTYNGINYTLNGYVNAVAGTTILSWLKHTEVTSRMRDAGQGAWDLLGLGDGTGTDWVNSNAQRRAFASVCEGQNTPTLTGALYSWFGLGVASANDNSITQPERDAITAKCTERLNNPQNPYFDKDKAGLHRFSINKWLERYRTISDDGETRLVLGAGTGSKVTDVNAYDVCLPSHVFFRFMDNERAALGSANADLYSQLMQLAITAVKEEHPNMFVCISGLDTRSTYFPELYPNFSIPKKVAASATGNWGFQRQLYNDFYATGLGQNEDQNKAWILPMFWTDPTAWGWNVEPIGSYLTSNPSSIPSINDYTYKVRDNADASHPGGYAHADWAYQLMSWIAYTYTI